MFTLEIASRGRNDLRPVSSLLTIPKGVSRQDGPQLMRVFMLV